MFKKAYETFLESMEQANQALQQAGLPARLEEHNARVISRLAGMGARKIYRASFAPAVTGSGTPEEKLAAVAKIMAANGKVVNAGPRAFVDVILKVATDEFEAAFIEILMPGSTTTGDAARPIG